ncbi:MAG: response regulator transcription factor [Ferruginibacter sp.]|nr:response regulator transcription factor [Ferruginibacter sp.]
MKDPGIKVLIVEDAQLVLDRLFEIINELPCVAEVFTAIGYHEAIALIEEQEPGLVLLDIHLPEKNGIELLQFLKQYYPAIKTVMLTNQATDNYKLLCEKIGADHFIDKSSEFEQITGIIESYRLKT